MNHGASAEQGEEEAAGMPPEASAGVPKGAYRMYVPGGIQVPLRARARKSEQCAGFASVSDKRKTAYRFSPLDLIRANPSSAQDLRASPTKEKRLGRFSTPDLKEQIRAVRDLQRARSAKFPAQQIASVSYERKTLQAFFSFRLFRELYL